MRTAPPDPLKRREGRGQPLRFLAAVLGLWIGGRVLMSSLLLTGAWFPALVGSVGATRFSDAGTAPPGQPSRYWPLEASVPATRYVEVGIDAPAVAGSGAPSRQQPTFAAASGVSESHAEEGAAPAPPPHSGSPPPAATAPLPLLGGPSQRWSGGAWIFWRENGGAAALGSAGQLGGSQAGVRIDRLLGRLGVDGKAMPVLLHARASRALDAPHQGEAALGMAVKLLTGRTPLTIGIERRIALEQGGRNAFALLAAGGLNPTRVFGPVIAEGYAQAGMVGLSRRDLFLDGRLALGLPLDRDKQTRAGLSLSGGAQPGVSRLDVGPMAETRLRLGPLQPRLVMEWRQRVAGQARPGSGLSVTLASDF